MIDSEILTQNLAFNRGKKGSNMYWVAYMYVCINPTRVALFPPEFLVRLRMDIVRASLKTGGAYVDLPVFEKLYRVVTTIIWPRIRKKKGGN